jgi:hypothetical protein
MTTVWALMYLNINEYKCHRQPTPYIFFTKADALRSMVEVCTDDIFEDEDEDVEKARVSIMQSASQLEDDGSCETYDGWFISLTEKVIEGTREIPSIC